MTLDVDQFLSKSKNADLIYIDSPNNPTGFQFSKQDIQKIIKKFSKKKRPEKNQNIATLILPLSSYSNPTPPHVA